MRRDWVIILLAMAFGSAAWFGWSAPAAELAGAANQVGESYLPAAQAWQVHEPIVHANLALFPVTAARTYSTANYLTLDEGLAAGSVKITELGGIVRPRPGQPPVAPRAEVTRLALVNESDKALILLAGEVVTGGKQDRVIAKDRVIPPNGEPLPLDVFCIEPGRWSGVSLAFESKSLMANPKLREQAQVARSQDAVWEANRETLSGVVGGVVGGVARPSDSYAVIAEAAPLRRKIADVSASLQQEYERALRERLREKNVIGVVVAVNGEVIWADLFAEPALFEKYWPKLLRSYVVEALAVERREQPQATRAAAEDFLAEQEGRQIIEVEPGEYRLVQVDHPRYGLFALTSLWEKTEPLLHFNKLRKENQREPKLRVAPITLPPPRR